MKDMHCQGVLTVLLSPIESSTFCQNSWTCYLPSCYPRTGHNSGIKPEWADGGQTICWELEMKPRGEWPGLFGVRAQGFNNHIQTTFNIQKILQRQTKGLFFLSWQNSSSSKKKTPKCELRSSYIRFMKQMKQTAKNHKTETSHRFVSKHFFIIFHERQWHSRVGDRAKFFWHHLQLFAEWLESCQVIQVILRCPVLNKNYFANICLWVIEKTRLFSQHYPIAGATTAKCPAVNLKKKWKAIIIFWSRKIICSKRKIVLFFFQPF